MTDTDKTIHSIPNIGEPIAKPDFLKTIADLQGGILPGFLSRGMADAASRVSSIGDANSKGKLSLELVFTQAKGEDALELKYIIKAVAPTMHGETSEIVRDGAIVFVNRNGAVSVAPEKQGKLNLDN